MNRAALLLTVLIGAILIYVVACNGDGGKPPLGYTLKTGVGPSNSPGTVSLVPAPDRNGTYSPGTVVKLTASPAGLKSCHPSSYWSFAGWSGDIQGSNPTASITMDADKIVTAAFEEIFPPRCPPSCKEPTLEISVVEETLQFGKERLEIAGGTEVVLCLTNVSSNNQHNWVLVRAGKKDNVAQRGSQHPENGWVQPGDPDVIAHTKILFPGERGEVRFIAPPAGPYQFVCSFPGHNITMFGDFVVTP